MRDHDRFRLLAALVALLVLGLCPPPTVAAEGPPDEPCPAECRAEAYWQKATEWLGSDRDDEARLLLRDLARDHGDTPSGQRARAWLEEHGDRNRDGRTEFIIGSTVMGAYFGYTATLGIYEDVLDGDAWKTATWMSLGGAVTGLTASALASRWMSISDSQATLYNFAGTWGWLNGYLLYDLIWPIRSSEVLVAGATGMGLGVVTSLALWPWLDVDEGSALMATTSGLYALELSSLLAVLVSGDGVFQENETLALLGVLLPANGAVVGGYFLGQRLRWSADDVRYVSLGGFLGNLLGAAVVASSDTLRDSSRAWAGITAASVVAGLVGGALIVRPWEGPAEASHDRLPLTAGIVHVDLRGVHVQPPLPRLAPVEHNGRLGYGIDVTLLTSEL